MCGWKCVAWFPHGVDRYVVACASHKNVSFAFRFADSGSVYIRKLAPPLVSYRLFDFVSRLHDDLVISYLAIGDTLHVDKIHMWSKIANITHALPVPVYQQTDFTPIRVVVSRLHAWYRCEISYKSEILAPLQQPRWTHAAVTRPAWHFVRYRVNRYRAMRGNWSELGPARKSPQCHVNTPSD